jgi:hypothetical protein
MVKQALLALALAVGASALSNCALVPAHRDTYPSYQRQYYDDRYYYRRGYPEYSYRRDYYTDYRYRKDYSANRYWRHRDRWERDRAAANP